MEDDIHAHLKDIMPEDIGAERRVASRIVGDRHGRHPAVGERIPGNPPYGIHGFSGGESAGDKLQSNDEIIGIENLSLKYLQHRNLRNCVSP